MCDCVFWCVLYIGVMMCVFLCWDVCVSFYVYIHLALCVLCLYRLALCANRNVCVYLSFYMCFCVLCICSLYICVCVCVFL